MPPGLRFGRMKYLPALHLVAMAENNFENHGKFLGFEPRGLGFRVRLGSAWGPLGVARGQQGSKSAKASGDKAWAQAFSGCTTTRAGYKPA